MMRRGVFGGTFDPIHLGHLDVARAARHALQLDEVMFVPSSVPPHRSAPHASAAHRFAMVALALQDQPQFIVSDLEMLEPGPSYTSATLDRLSARGVDTRSLFFVTGADAFGDIATWKDYPRLLDRCNFVVVSRPDHPAGAARTRLPALAARMVDRFDPAQGKTAILLVDAPTAAVSSTDVRRFVARGASIAGLVPGPVAGHIARHHLYKHPHEHPHDPTSHTERQLHE